MYYLGLTRYQHMKLNGKRRWIQLQRVYLWETPEQIDIIALYGIHTAPISALGPMYSCRDFIDPPSLCGFSGTIAKYSLIQAIGAVNRGQVSLCFLPRSFYVPPPRTAVPRQFPLDAIHGAVNCWSWADCLLSSPSQHIRVHRIWWCTWRSS